MFNPKLQIPAPENTWQYIASPCLAEDELAYGIAQTGNGSFRIAFGTADVAFRHVAQTTISPPGRSLFEADLRTDQLTTHQGIAFWIFGSHSASRMNGASKKIGGTANWTRLEASLAVPPSAALVCVEVVRGASGRFFAHITGTGLIDDTGIRPERQASASGA